MRGSFGLRRPSTHASRAELISRSDDRPLRTYKQHEHISRYGVARKTANRWLNPEPARMWDTGNSVASRYAQLVDLHEVRNIDQP